MANKLLFKPSDMNIKVNFTSIQTVKSSVNGSVTKKNTTVFTRYGAIKTRTLNQQYLTVGTAVEDTIVVGIKHDSRVNKTLGITINSVNYSIINISTDESNNYTKFDLITIKKVTK